MIVGNKGDENRRKLGDVKYNMSSSKSDTSDRNKLLLYSFGFFI
jgi:hypothetical protein